MNAFKHFLSGLYLVSVLGILSGCATQKQAVHKTDGPEKEQAAIDAVRPSTVKVEYWLQYDKGEAPSDGAFGTRCPNCGQYHGSDAGTVVKSEKPIEQPGYLLSGNRVITTDPVIESRFLSKIVVKKDNQSVDAKFAGFSKTGKAAILTLNTPLQGVTPLMFDPGAAAPYTAVTYANGNADWTLSAKPLSESITQRDYGKPFRHAPAMSVVLGATGKPLTVTPSEELAADDSWKTTPDQWEIVSAQEMQKLLDKTKSLADVGIVRVTLNFRSPRAQNDLASRVRYGSGEEENATVRHVLGVVVDPNTVLVLTELKPNVTARLEKVRIFPAEGSAIPATFVSTLTDYGALVVRPEQPLKNTLAFSDVDPRSRQTALLTAAKITMQGESRVCYLMHRRLTGGEIGWRQNVYPQLPGESDGLFIFDEDGKLMALPVSTREKAATKAEYSYQQNEAILTSGAQLRPVLANLSAHADANNIPLSEEQENRLAWLGVELQPLTAELARANNVSSLTNDGDSGALVTYVYDSSPAAKAGIQAGAVLLRVHVADQPKPIDVEVEASPYGDTPFPWDRLDSAPEEYFDRIPQPWPAVENSLTRALTDLGFGSAFKLEYHMQGQTAMKDFTVEQSPAYYNTAAKAKSGPLGLTVREITYEVRRYMQRKVDEPGVVISKIEIGSKASKAGLKPFEVITHVNDAPVNRVSDFEKLVENQNEVRLTIKRMTKGRIVKIAVTTPTTRPATTEPATSSN